MSLFIKLCGLKTAADVETAVNAGADAVGFVLTPSSRQIGVFEAAQLRKLVPQPVLAVAVFNDPSPDLVRQALAEVDPDLVQVEYRNRAAVPIEKFLPVVVNGQGAEEAIIQALELTESGMVLVDTAVKGGTGRRSDWGRLAGLEVRDRIIVAGGLNPRNVGEAISTIGPLGVDVSTGIERRPGEKDPVLMRKFVSAARAAGVRGAVR